VTEKDTTQKKIKLLKRREKIERPKKIAKEAVRRAIINAIEKTFTNCRLLSTYLLFAWLFGKAS